MTSSKRNIAVIVENAECAFWAIVAEMCPDIKTGDLDPAAAHLLTETMIQTVEAWINGNKVKPEESEQADAPLTLGWNRWHSGGGCMIWSLELLDGRSAHIGSDLLVLSSLGCEAHWEAAAEDADSTHHLLVVDLPSSDLKVKLLAFLVEDVAEKIAADAAIIYRPETSS